MAKRKTCGDCGTKEGQLHILGCDMERCPFCGNQLISCQCGYKKLGIDVSPGSSAYSHGLTEAQQEDWQKLLSDKGRIPFILYPNLCAKCGTLWPEMFAGTSLDGLQRLESLDSAGGLQGAPKKTEEPPNR
jgi:hypothetical protein